MISFFKKKPVEQEKPYPSLLGLRLGGVFELNAIKFKLIESDLIIERPATRQFIQAVGVVNLDSGHQLIRYYTDDEGYLQIVLSGGKTDNDIIDVKLWYFYDTQGISSDRVWDQALENEISMPHAELEGQQFQRYWDEGPNTPPVAMTETTYTEQGDESETDQFMMLYQRAIKNEQCEFLLICGEEKQIDMQFERCLVRSTGINLSSADFEVIA